MSRRYMAILSEMPVFFKNRDMILALPIFFVGTFRGISLQVLIQYTSVRFS